MHKGSQHTGKSEDPTGLYYFDARYYDPATCRFATRDTVFGDLADPQSLNRYVYCRDNSYKYTYPDGKIPIIEGVLHARSVNLVFKIMALNSLRGMGLPAIRHPRTGDIVCVKG